MSKSEWFQRARENAQEIKAEIDSLSNGHWSLFRRQYKEFWEHARQISEMFQSLKPLLHDDRQALWSKYQSICEDTKRIQQTEREERRERSRLSRELIESKIQEAKYAASGADIQDHLRDARAVLDKANEALREKESELLRDDRDECWEQWKAAKEEYNSRREFLWDVAYDHMSDVAGEALNEAENGDPYEARSKIREAQHELNTTNLRREQREEIKNILEDSWARTGYKIDERKREQRQRLEEQIEHLADVLDKQNYFASRLESEIDDLRDKGRNARNEDYARRVDGWLEDKLRKLEEVQRSVADLEDKIRSLRERTNRD